MSGYSGGRRAPNISQYLANLNTISSPESLSPQNDQGFGLDDDMNLFTNTQFFDNDFPGLHNADFSAEPASAATTQPLEEFAPTSHFKFPDFDLDPRFTMPSDIKSTATAGVPLAPQLSPTTASSPSSTARPSTSDDKRKLDAYISSTSTSATGNPVIEEAARVAADEDKRRRNTAASARFRVKKKQREQALEKTSKEMTEKASRLEAKVNQLEMENKWLKGLIMEKSDAADLPELWREFREGKQPGRIAEARKDGVGTA